MPNAIGRLETGSNAGVQVQVAEGSVNFRFLAGGHYTVSIVSADGKLLQTNAFDAVEGQVVNVALKGHPGLCLVKVDKDGKNLKSVKVIKK